MIFIKKYWRLLSACWVLVAGIQDGCASSWQEENEKARACMHDGHLEDSKQCLKRALKTCPPESRSQLLRNLATIEKRSGNVDEARKMLEEASASSPASEDPTIEQRIQNDLRTLTPINSTPNKITGTIQFQDRLPPLDPTLGRGNVFDKEIAEALLRGKSKEALLEWFKIPLWRAGAWTQLQATITRIHDFMTGETDLQKHTYTAYGNFEFVFIRDLNGALWSPLNQEYWSAPTTHDDCYSISFVRKIAVSQDAQDRFTRYIESAYFLIENKSGIIRNVRQDVSIDRDRPLAEGICHTEKMTRSYDAAGNLKSEFETIWNEKRHALCDSDYTAEEFKSFVAYMKSQGLESAVPKPNLSRTQLR